MLKDELTKIQLEKKITWVNSEWFVKSATWVMRLE
jgi:hypothetical protein